MKDLFYTLIATSHLRNNASRGLDSDLKCAVIRLFLHASRKCTQFICCPLLGISIHVNLKSNRGIRPGELL